VISHGVAGVGDSAGGFFTGSSVGRRVPLGGCARDAGRVSVLGARASVLGARVSVLGARDSVRGSERASVRVGARAGVGVGRPRNALEPDSRSMGPNTTTPFVGRCRNAV
jgi:hypothetical protein